jgi:hypothetical protein
MKKFLSLALIGAVVLGVSSVVYANVCAFDPVPAASLLFPFVAYDYNGGTQGTTTLFAITNVSSEAQIVHVTVWTDFSVAILDFNILLTGYDVQRMNIRDILANGNLPVTVNGAHTTFEGVADDGPVSDVNELHAPGWIGGLMDDPEATNALGARCASGDPAYPGQYTQAIPGSVLALFQQWLQSSQTEDRYHSDDCTKPFAGGYVLQGVPDPWFESRDDTTPTWMYITADVVETCNKTFPDEAGYWVPGTAGGEARYDNVLMGDVQWVDAVNRFSEADTAVHLEADVNLDLVATEGNLGFPVSFYARYANVNDGVSDFREPLPTAWAFRYIGADSANIHTYIRAWKGSTFWATIYDLDFDPYNESPDEFVATNCWAYTYYAWDDEENVLTSTTNPWSQPGGEAVVPNLLPLETQEVDIDQFNTVAANGWMLFVWPNSNVDAIIGAPATPDFYQTWMGVKYTAFGDYSTFMTGVVMANYNCFSDQVLPNLGINYGYIDPVTMTYTVSPCTIYDACF